MNERTKKIGNRMSGLAMIAFGGIIVTADQLPFVIGGGMFMAEGVGDLIKGTHHYVSTRMIKYLSRGKFDIEYD